MAYLMYGSLLLDMWKAKRNPSQTLRGLLTNPPEGLGYIAGLYLWSHLGETESPEEDWAIFCEILGFGTYTVAGTKIDPEGALFISAALGDYATDPKGALAYVEQLLEKDRK